MSEDKVDKIDQITVGMTANELFDIFPQALQVKKPDVFTDEDDPEKHLIVIHHYQGVDVKLEFAESGDPLYPLKCYAVQEVTRV